MSGAKNTDLCRDIRVLKQQVADLQQTIGVMMETSKVHNNCLDKIAQYMENDVNATADSTFLEPVRH